MSRVGSTALRITPIPLHHADHQGHFLLRNIQLPPPVEVPQNFVSFGQMPARAMAAAATEEVSRSGGATWLVGAATYSGATLVGLARMYHDMHWASDVVMGAAIGVFTGRRVVQWQHSHTGNRVDRWLLGVSVRDVGGGGKVVVPIVAPVR